MAVTDSDALQWPGTAGLLQSGDLVWAAPRLAFLGPPIVLSTLHMCVGIRDRSVKFSENEKCYSLSHVWLFLTLWTVACQALLSMEFSRWEYWSGLPFLSPGDLPKPRNWTWVSCTAGRFFTIWATREASSLTSMDMRLNKLPEIVKDREAWLISVHAGLKELGMT